MRRGIVIGLTLATALLLLWLQNKVNVGSQELTVDYTRELGQARVHLVFQDVAGRRINLGTDHSGPLLRDEVARRLLEGGVRSRQSIPLVEDSLRIDGQGGLTFELVLPEGREERDALDELLKLRLQGRGFRRPNEARSLFHMNLGIDLRGGVEFTCRLYDRNNMVVPADQTVVDILSKRLDARGLTEPQVTRMTNGDLQVVIPGGTQSDAAQTRAVLERTGRLEVREVMETLTWDQRSNTLSVRSKTAEPQVRERLEGPLSRYIVELPGGGYDFGPEYPFPIRPFDDVIYPAKPLPGDQPTVFYHLGRIALTGDNVDDAMPSVAQDGSRAVAINFSAEGGARNSVFTAGVMQRGPLGSNAGGTGLIAISLDGYVESAPIVREPSGRNTQISGNFSADEVEALRTVLKAGSLAVTPRVIAEQVVGPSLGQETINKGAWSMLFALLVVLAIMWAYYRKLGTVAVASLVACVLLIFVILSIFGATLTLPGLAGLVLTIGMAVDANILIFERLREELGEDVDTATGIDNGYARAFITILDASLTTFLTALILFLVGSGPVQGFGLTLMIGIMTSMFGALYVGRWVTELLYARAETGSVIPTGLIGTISLPYMNWRRPFMILSAMLAVGCLVYFIVGERHFDDHFDIDFTGGGMMQLNLQEAMDTEEVRRVLAERHAADPERNDLLDPTGMQLQPYFADFGLAGSASRQWVFKARDPVGARLERERADLEDQLAEQRRRLVASRERETPDRAAVAAAEREIERLNELIVAKTAEVQDRQDDLHRQLSRAFDDKLAPEGSEIVAAAWEDDTLDLSLALMTAPSTEALREIEARLARREDLAEVRAEAIEVARPDGVGLRPGVRLRMSLAALPPPLAQLDDLGAGAQRDRLMALLGEPADGAARARIAVTQQLLARVTERLAAANLAVDRPFASSQHFSPIVGDQMKWRALMAMVIALLCILAYIAARFEMRYGMGAIAALLHDLFVTIGVTAALGVRIDLTVVAALMTIIGYSLNDTIVVFDRIRENVRKVDKPLRDIIDLSIAQTMSRTIMTSGTTIGTVLILFLFGGDGLRGFSATLLVGLAFGTYSSIFIASPMLLLLGPGRPSAALLAQATREDMEGAVVDVVAEDADSAADSR